VPLKATSFLILLNEVSVTPKYEAMCFSPKLRKMHQPLLPFAPDKTDLLKELPISNLGSKKNSANEYISGFSKNF